jgi:hypothetical protein
MLSSLIVWILGIVVEKDFKEKKRIILAGFIVEILSALAGSLVFFFYL